MYLCTLCKGTVPVFCFETLFKAHCYPTCKVAYCHSVFYYLHFYFIFFSFKFKILKLLAPQCIHFPVRLGFGNCLDERARETALGGQIRQSIGRSVSNVSRYIHVVGRR